MIGVALALIAAFLFAAANSVIAKSAQVGSHGDNGVFLSVVMTVGLSGTLWIAIGPITLTELPRPGLAPAIAYFVIAGFLSTVLGRGLLYSSILLAGAIAASFFRRLIPAFAAVFAVVLLGEAIGWFEAIGIAVILASVIAVALDPDRKSQRDKSSSGCHSFHQGQVHGVTSAAAYGASFVGRKLGMEHVADPLFGTLVGAVVGLLWFIGRGVVSASYRRKLRASFEHLGPWRFIGALCISLGQIAQFFALQNSTVATVAIIGSLEVFMSIYIAAFVTKTESPPSVRVVLASVVAMGGAALLFVRPC